MIPVFINGTVCYRIGFARRRYSSVKRKCVGLSRILKAIDDTERAAKNSQLRDRIRAIFAGRPLYETTVSIYIGNSRRGDPPVASATVRQSPTDAHSPEQGRQWAIEKLLNRDSKKFGGALSIFTKTERQAIRKAYAERPRTAPEKTPPPAPPAIPSTTRPVAARIPTTAPRDTHAAVSKVVPIARPWYDPGNPLMVH